MDIALQIFDNLEYSLGKEIKLKSQNNYLLTLI